MGTADEEFKQRLADTAPTRKAAEAFRDTNRQMIELRTQFGEAARELGATFLPAMSAVLDALLPIVDAFGTLIKQNPQLLTMFAAVGVAVVGLVGTIWALNAALSVKAALSGPVGWASLAAAAALGTGVAIGGGFALRNVKQEIASAQQALDEETKKNDQELYKTMKTAAYEGITSAQEAHRRELQNILPACPQEALESAVEPLKKATMEFAKVPEIVRDGSRPTRANAHSPRVSG